jgi:hypothetical protein
MALALALEKVARLMRECCQGPLRPQHQLVQQDQITKYLAMFRFSGPSQGI